MVYFLLLSGSNLYGHAWLPKPSAAASSRPCEMGCTAVGKGLSQFSPYETYLILRNRTGAWLRCAPRWVDIARVGISCDAHFE
jgi:hypothetical protein